MAETKRLYDLDTLRAYMVLLIVLLHTSCAYAFSIPWWHAQDQKHMFFDVLNFIIDNFALAVLFFVAGVFAWPSLKRRSPGSFVLGKLKRLGLPLVLLSAFYMPAMVYVGYLHRAPETVGFWPYWLHWMQTAGDWSIKLITTMEDSAPYADAFSPHPLWFVSMLLIFFLAYALWRAIVPAKDSAGPRIGVALLICGGLMFAGYALINTLVQDWAWARIGPLVLFQPTRVPVYAMAFVLGIMARPRMDRDRPMPGPIWLWLCLFLLAQAAMVLSIEAFFSTPGPAPLPVALMHASFRTLLTISAICLTANASRRLWAAPSAWRSSLAASSYDIYMLHMPLVVFAQTLLIPAPVPLIFKWATAFTVTVALCWLLSRSLAKWGPTLYAALLAIYFLGFCLLT